MKKQTNGEAWESGNYMEKVVEFLKKKKNE